VSSGKILFDGKVINNLIPQKREFGIVFQSYALFPNMTVEDNIVFGLKVRKMLKGDGRKGGSDARSHRASRLEKTLSPS